MEIVDLRGRHAVIAAAQVLADPSGRRARMLRRAGRVIAVVFLLWLFGLILAGLGILPAGSVPLAPSVSPSAPPSLTHAPSLTQPTAADLKPALPASARLASTALPGAAAATHTTAGRLAGQGQRGSGGSGSGAGRHGSGPSGQQNPTTLGASGASGPTGTGTPASTGSGAAAGSASGAGNGTGAATHGKATAPGQTTKQSAPGHTSTTAPGNSTSAPGQTKQTTTTTSGGSGQSGSSPGHTGSAPGQPGPRGNARANGG
jgi:hypothetical protein